MAESVRKGLSIRGKLLGMVAFWVCVFLVVGAMVGYGIYRSNIYMDELTHRTIPELTLVDDADYQVARARRYEKELFLFSSIKKTPEVIKKQQGYLKKLVERYQMVEAKIEELKALEKTSGLFHSAEVPEMVTRIEQAYRATAESLVPMTDELMAGKDFLSVSEFYALYKKNVHDLEGNVKNLREFILAGVDGKKAATEAFHDQLARVLLAAGILGVGFGVGFGLYGSSRISTSVDQLMRGIRAAGEGRFEEVEVTTHDEFAEIARVFNETVPKIQTDEERQEMEKNLIHLLEIVSEASEGDLTMKAPVTADVFGSVADAYNLMVEGLAELIATTNRQAGEVGSQTERLIEIFQTMETGAGTQAAKVEQATESVTQTASASEAIAEKATQAQQVSKRVDEATSVGNATVVQNIEGMQLIRVIVQTINKRMKSLSERLLEIGTISELISEIATRTTILAMNASIEASRAGEQGRGFMVISDEIKKLADKSSEATKQIGGVIKAIQTEAGEVTAALEDETRTVEEQTRLAKEAGESFAAIEHAISASRSVVTEISALSENQRALTAETVSAMETVTQLSFQTRSMVRNSAQIAEGLNAMSVELLGSISRFQLPEPEEAEVDIDFSTMDEISEEAEAGRSVSF